MAHSEATHRAPKQQLRPSRATTRPKNRNSERLGLGPGPSKSKRGSRSTRINHTLKIRAQIAQQEPNTATKLAPPPNRPPTPTLPYANRVSNKFSWTPGVNCQHQHITKNKLTGGYRKRLSGSREIHENAKLFPENPVANSTLNSAHRQRTNVHARGKPFNHGFRAEGL